MPFNLLFRDDIFISYSRGDGGAYAAGLADELTAKKFSCFIDKLGTEPNQELPASLKKKIRNCTLMVLVGTERGAASKFVAEEITEFKKTKRTIVPVDFGGTVGRATWYDLIPGLAAEPEENPDALRLGDPSDNVISRIEKSFNYTRRNMRMMRLLVITTAVLLTLITASAVAAVVARNNMLKADAQTQKAAEKTRIADAAETRAAEQTKKAEDAGARAESASATAKRMEEQAQKAEKDARLAQERAAAAKAEAARAQAEAAESQAKAKTAEKAARDATEEAKRQEALALSNAKEAEKQQQIAEERTTYVRAQQLGVQADIDVDKGGDLERSVLLSVESLKRAGTPDGYAAWAKGMELLPRADEAKFADAEGEVSAVAYSRDGRLFAQGTKHGVVKFFWTDGKTEPVERQLRLHNEIMTIVFGEDWVAAANAGEFVMWDLKDFKVLRSSASLQGFHGDSVAFSPDGRYVAVGGPSGKRLLSVFDTVTNATVIRKQVEHVFYVMGVAFSPDGKWLAVGCHYRKYERAQPSGNVTEVSGATPTVGRVLFWDVASFEKAAAPDPAGWLEQEVLLYRAVFGPRGDHLATEDHKGDVRLWSVDVGDDGRLQLKRTNAQGIRGGSNLDFPKLGKATLVFSPDESYVATVTDRRTARVWDVGSGREVSRIRHEKDVESIAFGFGGQFATAGGDVKFWKTQFGSDAERLARDDKTPVAGGRVMAVSPGGEWLVTTDYGGAQVFRTTDWSPVKLLKEAIPFSTLLFSPDGRWLVTGGQARVTVFETGSWDVRKKVLATDENSKVGVEFSPDGRWLLMNSLGLVRLLEVGSWQEVHATPQDKPVDDVVFSPDGRWFAARVKGEVIGDAPRGHAPRERKPSEIYIWDTSDWKPAACRAAGAAWPSALTRTVCADVKGAGRGVLLSEVRKWKKTPPGATRPAASEERPWSVDDDGGIKLLFQEEKNKRQVAALMPGGSPNGWTFTPDNHWLIVSGQGGVGLWPLERARMIDAACARLRRRDLTEEERKQYISDGGTDSTCAPAH